MNFTYLVESGKYTKDMLNEKQKAFIDGMETAIEDIDLYESNIFCDDEDPLYEQVMTSIKEETAKEIKACLESTKNTYIVTFADDNADREMYE